MIVNPRSIRRLKPRSIQKRCFSGGSWQEGQWRYNYYDPPVHDKIDYAQSCHWTGKTIAAFVFVYWSFPQYNKMTHKISMGNFTAAQINAVYPIKNCVAPYKRADLNWEYEMPEWPEEWGEEPVYSTETYTRA